MTTEAACATADHKQGVCAAAKGGEGQEETLARALRNTALMTVPDS